MMKADIRLEFGRLGELYHGTIKVKENPTVTAMTVLDFQEFPFARMMSHLARTVREHHDVRVVLSRLEIGGSDYILDAATVELLRDDPPAAIETMSHPDATVVVRDRRHSVRPPKGLLRAGHDTIAEAFGDSIYVSLDDGGRFECVGCGRWSPVTTMTMPCVGCGITPGGYHQGGSWFVTTTEAVLKLGRREYYIPRSWNPEGWIAHVDLTKMYETYKKERDRCYQENGLRA